MLTILILIAAFRAGCPLLGFALVAIGWGILICGFRRNASGPSRQDPIDRYGDEHFGDIDWLRKGKL